MTFHMLWGWVLWFSISKYGLGISTDSMHLLFAALNLFQGRGLFSFDGTFVSAWPPLYPVLLALVQLVLRLDPLTAATVCQFLSFLGISVCVSLLYLKIFPENFGLAFAACLVSDIGVTVLDVFTFVDSDYVHLFLVLLFILLSAHYIEGRSPRMLVGMAVVGMLATLQRYLGIALIATGVVLILFFGAGSLKQRAIRSSLMAFSALPAGIWLVVTSPLTVRRAPVSFGENFTWFSRSIMEWFFQIQPLRSHLTLLITVLWILLGGLIGLWLLFVARGRTSSFFETALFTYGLFYVLALFGSASVAYFNKLSGRFLLPVYIPLMTLLLVMVGVLIQSAQRMSSQSLRLMMILISIGILGGTAAGLLHVTLPLALETHDSGAPGGFSTKAWQENRVLTYWLSHPPPGDYLLFSNYPDGIAFYTWHECYNAPAEYSGPYGKIRLPVSDYSAKLFSSGRAVYLIWIEPNLYSYYYKIEDLSPIAQIEPVFVDQDGGIYRLKPKAGNGP